MSLPGANNMIPVRTIHIHPGMWQKRTWSVETLSRGNDELHRVLRRHDILR